MDPVVAHLEVQIARKNISYKRINVELFPDEEFYFSVKREKILSEYHSLISGIFVRFFQNISGKTLDLIPAQYRTFVKKELNDILITPLLSLDENVRWINAFDANFRASIKLAQLKTAIGVGFRVPDTIVSSNTAKLVDFWREKNGRIISKAIHQGLVSSNPEKEESEVIFTNIVDENNLSKLDPIKNYPPILFQEAIDKISEFRVVVIKDQCFCCLLGKTSFVDWRKDKEVVANSTSFDLPQNVIEKCVNVVSQLGLSFGVIDLILDKTGDYYFLEVNPQGGWLWMETRLGYPISQCIIDYLVGK
jgi:glutathione synthase/RimK-type ligase-like ATP-grasp enzyme